MTVSAPVSSPTSAESLVQRSLEVILAGQDRSGAFVAAPTYPTYGFGWLRDGAFCAYAMLLRGEHTSAAAFHRWAASTILRHQDQVRDAIAAARDGADPSRMLPTRFTLDGQIEPSADDVWPNFQLDGYGTWLWVLGQHLAVDPSLADEVTEAAGLTVEYLRATADLACYDCWEEWGDGTHTSTVGAVAAGLAAAGSYLGDCALSEAADDLIGRLRTRHVHDGALVKQIGDRRVDASTLWLALPFGVLAPDDPLMVATADRIRAELLRAGGGVTRYQGDTFYGGGAWILLTAWLGWYELATGRPELAEARYRWIVEAATPQGDLPEQLTTDPQAPEQVAPWVERWGPVATPLLWSHAMYLVLDHHRNVLRGDGR
jgi:GH15 family glucan-1,4-alpha-glucosidase